MAFSGTPGQKTHTQTHTQAATQQVEEESDPTVPVCLGFSLPLGRGWFWAARQGPEMRKG